MGARCCGLGAPERSPRRALLAWPGGRLPIHSPLPAPAPSAQGSSQGHWRFPHHAVEQGYAYILTHPGTPCVFWDHLLVRGRGGGGGGRLCWGWG